MYIRIDLSVFFVTQNVGETSKVEFSRRERRKYPALQRERNLKKKFFRRRVPFCDVANIHHCWHHQKQTTKKTSSSFEEDVENLAKGVSHYCMMLQLTTKIKALFEAVKTFSSCTLLSLSS